MSATPERIQGKGFEVTVVRTDRKKTASLRVEEGQVSIVVPRALDEERIAGILKKKNRWIKEKISIHGQFNLSKSKEYVSGESFTYLGRNYRLKVVSSTKRSVKLVSGRLVVNIPRDRGEAQYVSEAITEWYRARALSRLREKVARYSKQVGVEPESVSIKTLKSRWGSCSRSGDLLFNWKIIIAPSPIVDYVVVHELCHMKHHNHSHEFWREVERILPDYLQHKEWLKSNSLSLTV